MKNTQHLNLKAGGQAIDKAAFEYATHASSAPDKETPDWIITDFKAGAKWERQNGESYKLLIDVCKLHSLPEGLRKRIVNYLGIPF